MMLARTSYTLPKSHPSPSLLNSPREANKGMLSKPYHTELGLGEENGQAYRVETYLSAQAKFRSQRRDVRPCRHGGKTRYPVPHAEA